MHTLSFSRALDQPPVALCYNPTMSLPHDLKLYSVPASNTDGTVTMSLRFALTAEEFAFATENGIIPDETTEIDMIQDLPQMHDLHFPAQLLQ
jgi:hypothetical protein